MTVLGAVVFGGLLALAVLWLLITAPSSDVDPAYETSPGAAGGPDGARVLTYSSSSSG